MFSSLQSSDHHILSSQSILSFLGLLSPVPRSLSGVQSPGPSQEFSPQVPLRSPVPRSLSGVQSPGPSQESSPQVPLRSPVPRSLPGDVRHCGRILGKVPINIPPSAQRGRIVSSGIIFAGTERKEANCWSWEVTAASLITVHLSLISRSRSHYSAFCWSSPEIISQAFQRFLWHYLQPSSNL